MKGEFIILKENTKDLWPKSGTWKQRLGIGLKFYKVCLEWIHEE